MIRAYAAQYVFQMREAATKTSEGADYTTDAPIRVAEAMRARADEVYEVLLAFVRWVEAKE